jgi:hypothetical protein
VPIAGAGNWNRAATNGLRVMTKLTKTVRRVTAEKYGHGKKARQLVVAFERGDIIAIHELRRRTVYRARLWDAYWWMLRCQADKSRMEKLREIKARKATRLAARRQRDAERRLFRADT